MSAMTSLDFAQAARLIGRECRVRGLSAPSFRSPPRIVGQLRSIRRVPPFGTVVAVAIRGRSKADVIADLIEGAIAANDLDGEVADRLRSALTNTLLTGGL